MIDLVFAVVLFFASFLWAGRGLKGVFARWAAFRGHKPDTDEFWEFEETVGRRSNTDYALRHRRLFEADEDSREPSSDGWRVRSVHVPDRCEICHQRDEFDPATQCCRRCGHYTT